MSSSINTRQIAVTAPTRFRSFYIYRLISGREAAGMDLKKFVDISAFFLVESSGDSEEDYDDCDHGVALAEDDAESCCCGMPPDVACMEDSFVADFLQDYGEVEDGKREDEHDSHRLGDGNWSWQEVGLRSRARKGSTHTEEKKKVKVVKDASDEVMSEEEKNRLFWKTCLAL